MTSLPSVLKRKWGSTAILPYSWDQFAYDDIMATVRREGRLDVLGCDLIPSGFDNHNSTYWFNQSPSPSPSQQWKAADKLAMGRAAQAQAEWEAARAARQEEQRQASEQQWDVAAAMRGEYNAAPLPDRAIDQAGNQMCREIINGLRSPFCASFRVLIIEKRRRRYVAQGTTPEAALEHATLMAFREAKHYHRETKAAWYLDQRRLRHD